MGSNPGDSPDDQESTTPILLVNMSYIQEVYEKAELKENNKDSWCIASTDHS